jgi:hypothetical protein
MGRLDSLSQAEDNGFADRCTEETAYTALEPNLSQELWKFF